MKNLIHSVKANSNLTTVRHADKQKAYNNQCLSLMLQLGELTVISPHMLKLVYLSSILPGLPQASWRQKSSRKHIMSRIILR